MANLTAKLRPFIKQIRYSTVLKAASFAAAWLILPTWLFLIIAIYLYFFPPFHSLRLILPFLILIFFSLTQASNVWLASFFGILFYLIIAIKDFSFIKRAEAYEMLIFLLLFGMSLRFFAYFGSWDDWSGFLYAFMVSAIFFLLSRGFLRFRAAYEGNELPPKVMEKLALGTLLLWQLFIVILVLPLNFLYQTALLFLISTILFETIFDHVSQKLSKKRILFNFSIIFSFLVVILGSARWNL